MATSEEIARLRQNKVFGVGFSKTGTTSIEQACLDIGLKVCRGDWKLKHNDYHLALYAGGFFEELHRMTRYWDAFFDGPWGGDRLYLKLAEWYPDAYFIQTIRDPDKWYDSLANMVKSFRETESDDPIDAYHRGGCHGSVLFFEKIFGISGIDEKERILEHYTRTNAEVEAFFSNGPYRFLQIDVTAGEGWEKLGPFLGISDPPAAFPQKNVRKENRKKRDRVDREERRRERLEKRRGADRGSGLRRTLKRGLEWMIKKL
jgi:hypothetical protein